METEQGKRTTEEPTVHGWRAKLFSLFADPAKLLTQPIKLPGWAAILFAVFVFFPDWHARFDFWLHIAEMAGGKMGLLAAAITSPYFSPTLAVAGVLWIFFVGEPKGVQRRHWLRYVGWSVFLICITIVAITVGYGAIEFYIQQQVSSRDLAIQKSAAVRPVFWHLTEAQRTSLTVASKKIPIQDRFDISIKCLPDAGSRTFVQDIAKVFLDDGWKLSVNCFFSNIRPDLVGIMLSVPKSLKENGTTLENFPPKIRTMMSLLDSAGIPFQFAADDVGADQFFLVIGNAP